MPSRISLLDAYRSGLSLRLATFKYAPPDLLRAYCEDASFLREQEDWSDEKLAEAICVDAMTFHANPFYSLSLAKIPAAVRSKKLFPSQHLEKMQVALFDNLHKGGLILLGYVKKRELNAAPKQVPAELYERRFVKSWDACQISGNALKFVAVRIVSAAVFHPEAADVPRLGRKSRKIAIIAAFDGLIASGVIKTFGTDKQIWDAVRMALVGDPLPRPGLSDATIRRHTLDRPR